MALIITPFGRAVPRRAWARRMYANRMSDYAPVVEREEDYAEPVCDVIVPVNVKGSDEAYTITAVLPGVKGEDVNIQVVEETVTIQGEFQPAGEENETFLLREVPTGRFYRAIRLPDALDANKAEADLTDGVLTLRVPKAETARPRTIKVQAN